ncbi:hypothetical protein IWX65_001006 [Arthrobacter sp. CAN_A214]
MNWFNWVSLCIQALTASAIVFAALQFVGSQTQRHREFENLYVQRYWDLLDRMSFNLYMNKPLRLLSGSNKRVIHAYLRLCEDELDLREQGFITDRTWKVWSLGMRAQLKSEPYAAELQKLGLDDLPALRQFLPTGRDPLLWRWYKRWWSGLR